MKSLFTYIRAVSLSLVVVFAALTSARADEAKGTLHLYSVGISQYARLNNLTWADKDVGDLEKVLAEKNQSTYARMDAQKLVNGQATRGAIVKMLDDAVANAQPGDTCIFTLSGHGGYDLRTRDSDWFFATYDTDAADMPRTALAAAVLRGKLNELCQRGVKVVCILDSCYCGAMTLYSPQFTVLAACQLEQVSREDGPSGTMKNGFFIHALIEALQGQGDINGDGVITLDEAANYARVRVAGWISSQGGEHLPDPRQIPVCVAARPEMPLAQLSTTVAVATEGRPAPRQPRN